ncbi:integrator complex subunit 14 [Peromyscus eremicus]|uniref:integrator complex subunit 14 n=1 Tax=Peromyscus eremicus TaxID=42410 RepID=UPI0027DD35D0|nr:integrator complex subunit 14 [Peromyscus eremicus]
MPTVVVMDVSLSMTRPVSVEGSEEYQRKHLAAHGLTMLFEHMATNYKLEFTALVVFSSLWELMVPFTRDYNTLQEALSNMDDYDKTCLESALVGTDVQKILRNARKLPEKTQTFYKELNRLRKAALAFGFLDLLKGVADMLERECTLLPDTAHPDAAFQLTHAAQQLKLASTGTSEYAAYDHNITPLHTDFSGSSTERL